jgi:hypothetical protein
MDEALRIKREEEKDDYLGKPLCLVFLFIYTYKGRGGE